MTFDAKPEENMFPLEHRGGTRYAPPLKPLSLHAVTSPHLPKRSNYAEKLYKAFLDISSRTQKSPDKNMAVMSFFPGLWEAKRNPLFVLQHSLKILALGNGNETYYQ